MRAEEVLLYGIDWGWMLVSLFFGVMSHVFRGWRWKQTLAPLGVYPKSSDCVDAIFISYAANLVLPRVGEVSRCGVLAKYDDVSFAKSLGTVVTERLIDMLSIVLIAGVAFWCRCLSLSVSLRRRERRFLRCYIWCRRLGSMWPSCVWLE